MSDVSGFQMSQGYEVLPPRSGRAYPIPCDEWNMLRDKISKTTSEPWLFQTAGSVLIGMSLSALLPIITDIFQLPAQQHAYYISFLVVIGSAICGIAFFGCALMQRKLNRERASDVVAQMQLIEKRYEHRP